MPIIQREVDMAWSDTIVEPAPCPNFLLSGLGMFCGQYNGFCGTIGVAAVVAGTRPLRGLEVPVTVW
jgi:hypothetical protein